MEKISRNDYIRRAKTTTGKEEVKPLWRTKLLKTSATNVKTLFEDEDSVIDINDILDFFSGI